MSPEAYRERSWCASKCGRFILDKQGRQSKLNEFTYTLVSLLVVMGLLISIVYLWDKIETPHNRPR